MATFLSHGLDLRNVWLYLMVLLKTVEWTTADNDVDWTHCSALVPQRLSV